MKKTLAILVLLAGLAWALRRKVTKVTTTILSRKEFVTTLEPVARRIQQEFGIQPKITLTQSALESRWGQSQLARDGNNLFGVTAEKVSGFANGEWTAKPGYQIIVLPTWEDLRSGLKPEDFPKGMVVRVRGNRVLVKRPFRRYLSWYESVRGWATLIATAPRYAKAYAAARAGKVSDYAREIKAAGYATDVNYDNEILAFAAAPELANV